MDAVDWRERFDAFVARKTRAAVTAALPPYVTEVEQPPEEMLAIGSDWTRELFGGSFYLSPDRDPKRPSCSLVFVRSADGNTGGNPGDLGGGHIDKHLVYEGLSRVAADAVLAGADSVRGGDVMFSVWHPALVRLRASLGFNRHPIQVVATLRGVDLDRMLLFNVPGVPAVVITAVEGEARMREGLRARPWVRAIVMRDNASLAGAFADLRALGIMRISCIGGRRLAQNLVAAGLIDDVYLTTAPTPGGAPNTPLPSSALAGSLIVRKCGTREETGVVFEHLVAST